MRTGDSRETRIPPDDHTLSGDVGIDLFASVTLPDLVGIAGEARLSFHPAERRRIDRTVRSRQLLDDEQV
ncbi:hypothetical protein GCM10010401_19120 [Rarobacter faecitabidus]|uniref:Uncharacterized protein n=1 Tax=Rarobacter faecitabidus TaxID=13243 RepID=A0A542ZUZ2_RARFA|nr:hypothetical protein FB461_0610 [Rarobacter faecitabidus]